MKIFTDFHHGALYFSLHLLFEQRLGWEIYRPIGFDWFHEGFWKIAEPYGNAMDTVGQYLDINQYGFDQYKRLNGEHYVKDDIYYVRDRNHDYYQKSITLEQFKSMDFDIIMPTYSPHDKPYLDLKETYQPKAKMLAQLGNNFQRSNLPNVLHSVPFTSHSKQNTLYYHQEIDPRYYKYEKPNPKTKNIYSMVNCLPFANIYLQYKNLLTDVNMKAYGASCPDGVLDSARGVGPMMTEANVGWHLKVDGGLGHTAMGWFACGRPVIASLSNNKSWGKDAQHLFEPGVTCLDIEANSVKENCKLIRRMLEPEENLQWAERTQKRFNEVINYNEEEQQIRNFLGRLS